MHYLRASLAMLLLALPAQFAFAQVRISGTISDAVTGESLPAANIQIEGTLRGTISNSEGRYELRVEELPATLLVYYIGYATTVISLDANTTSPLDIRLRPVVLPLPELVVGPDDPAIGIMRQVIQRK